ncbi:MAG: leucine-rich repeat domain-containing protein [Bacteroidota bacterium]
MTKLAALYKSLLSDYTHSNLHAITSKIIDLYKNKQFHSIDRIMEIVTDHTKEAKTEHGKAFYKLMMIYHPDRMKHYLAEIEKHFHTKDEEQLRRYAHIGPVMELERTLRVEKEFPSEIREPEEYGYDESPDAFHDVDEEEQNDDEEIMDIFDEPVKGRSFYTTFKQQVYGTANIELPFYYLEELDSLDLSGYEINDLDGLSHCKNLMTLDLSNNFVDDIADISSLLHLRELYLTSNRIGYIDALSFCLQLKVVDLSYNTIDDISPLLELDELEYVNLVGNPVPAQQIAALKKRNVIVIG